MKYKQYHNLLYIYRTLFEKYILLLKYESLLKSQKHVLLPRMQTNNWTACRRTPQRCHVTNVKEKDQCDSFWLFWQFDSKKNWVLDMKCIRVILYGVQDSFIGNEYDFGAHLNKHIHLKLWIIFSYENLIKNISQPS